MAYFNEFAFEKGGKFYKTIGIQHFKKFVPFGDYFFRLVRLFRPGISMVAKKQDVQKEAVSLVAFTVLIEAIHLLFFFVMMVLLIRTYILTGKINTLNIALNLLINALPVLVQRYNRIRILRTFNLRLSDCFAFMGKKQGTSLES